MSDCRILVADELTPEALEILSKAGQVVQKKGLKPPDLARELPPYHALVVRSATLVDAEGLGGAQKLVVIGRAGIGVDNIDVEAATARGIVVMNTPESGAVTTAELAIAHLMALARKIPEADRLLHEGRWEKTKLSGVEVTGKTLGVLGLGRIGRVVASRALGLAMRVIAHDPAVPEDRVPAGVTMVPFERLFAESDFVTVHVPLMDVTRHLVGAKAFELMKPGARLIHCSRGGIVDEAALIAALTSGRLAGAAVDVFEKEPLPKDDPLLRAPNLVLTPHLGASTEEARHAVARDIARQVVDCLKTGLVVNGVNVPHVAPGDAEFLSPFLTLAERLASLLVQAYPGALREVRIQTQGEVGERSQRPILVAALVGALRPGSSELVTPVNAERIAKARQIAVSSERSVLKKDFVNLVRVEIVVGSEHHAASGTLIGRRHLRMVELDEFLLDAIPEGHLLITRHLDQPGMMGRIGTVLGDAGVNIARLQLGVARERSGEAIGILNVDSAVPPDVATRMRAVPGILDVKSVDL
jgi:D-3-phosphoglycerate dehydrogenase / 2-oxoglutarate reductase